MTCVARIGSLRVPLAKNWVCRPQTTRQIAFLSGWKLNSIARNDLIGETWGSILNSVDPILRFLSLKIGLRLGLCTFCWLCNSHVPCCAFAFKIPERNFDFCRIRP